MMQTDIKFVVVGHHSRRKMAQRLYSSLGAHHILTDEIGVGANEMHRRALEWAAEQSCRVVVLEDDALPVPQFHAAVVEWLARFPDNLVSFYLGTGCPAPYQLNIAVKLIEADSLRNDHVIIQRLLHGVCYSIPPSQIDNVLRRWDPAKPADYAVGDAYGGSVVYPVYSLVDHTDGDSVEHGQCRQRRKAWRLNA